VLDFSCLFNAQNQELDTYAGLFICSFICQGNTARFDNQENELVNNWKEAVRELIRSITQLYFWR
jgi:hypothetical protein